MLYLHVVDYNISAIKFYKDKNGFKLSKVEKLHYQIFDSEYDALVFYKFIDREQILED